MTTSRKLLLASVSVSILALGALHCHAAELINDTFTAGTAAQNGYYFYNNNSGGTAWATTNFVPSGATLLSGASLRNNVGSASNTMALKSFASFAFTAVGDSISVSLSFRSNGTSGSLNNFGFYNATNAITANSFGGTDLSANAGGYGITKLFAANSVSSYRTSSGTTLFTSTATASIGDVADHTLGFTLTMTETGLQISGSIDGVSQGSYIDTSVTATSGFSVNTLKLAATTSTTYWDNVVVTTNTTTIPEVGTIWFGVTAGFVAMGATVRRRRAESSHAP